MNQIFKGVSRPSLSPGYDSTEKTLTFHVLDVLSSSISSASTNYKVVPTIRLYGVTQEGFTVLTHVYGFETYLWIEAPANWTPKDSEVLKKNLNIALVGFTNTEETVTRIEMKLRKSIMYYRKEFTPHLQIYVQLPQHIPKLRAALTNGITCPGSSCGFINADVLEGNVDYILRFMTDTGMYGSNWVTIKSGSYRYISEENRNSSCQIEVQCDYHVIANHEAEKEYSMIAPFRILSFDIECKGRKGIFPEAEHDSVIQIANHCVTYGRNLELVSKSVFTLNTCGLINGADVFSFEKEEEMLLAWHEYIKAIDPDIFTGYNISNFDFPYLIDRAKALKLPEYFQFLGRELNGATVIQQKNFQSNQIGNRIYKTVTIKGRVIMDAMILIQREYKLGSYSLNSVSQFFLKEQKEDVHYSIISDLQDGTANTRRRLAIYCLKDAYLPIRLLDKLMLLFNVIEMARVTGVTLTSLIEGGQQIKVFSMILRKAREKELLLPQPSPSKGAFIGGEVFSPICGYHESPVVVLDFASLYPSIIIAHNLCYSTLLQPGAQMDESMVEVSPTGAHFVKKTVSQGILPEILRDLLDLRKSVRKEMKKVDPDSLEYKVLNGRQLAIKVSANSVYGFTGAANGRLPCKSIAGSTTSYGRDMVKETKAKVLKFYPDKVEVLYGDTDSVMVRWDVGDKNKTARDLIIEAQNFGEEAAKRITSSFDLEGVMLEFEKVYLPFLLLRKKRYAGLRRPGPDEKGVLETKGIETVRRDKCRLNATIVSGILNRLMIQGSKDAAVEFTKGTIRDLVNNRIDMSDLVMSKSLSKPVHEYPGKQMHVEVAKKRAERDPAGAPSVGDRIPFVLVKGGKMASENSEDPIYALENELPIDTDYYLKHLIGPSIERYFETVLTKKEIEAIKHGNHTKSCGNSSSKPSDTGLMAFIKAGRNCIRCKSTVKDKFLLCEKCRPYAPEIYCKVLAHRNYLESMYTRIWTQCQKCQNSLTQKVICSNNDCPIFYMRKKVEQNLNKQQTLLDDQGW